jgi:hypothetical protein
VPYVALIDFTMHHPFRHYLSRAAHETDAIFHGNPQTLLNNAHDGVAGLAAGRFVYFLERLLKPRHVLFGLGLVLLEGAAAPGLP